MKYATTMTLASLLAMSAVSAMAQKTAAVAKEEGL